MMPCDAMFTDAELLESTEISIKAKKAIDRPRALELTTEALDLEASLLKFSIGLRLEG
jgi:hypothetical protein